MNIKQPGCDAIIVSWPQNIGKIVFVKEYLGFFEADKEYVFYNSYWYATSDCHAWWCVSKCSPLVYTAGTVLSTEGPIADKDLRPLLGLDAESFNETEDHKLEHV